MFKIGNTVYEMVPRVITGAVDGAVVGEDTRTYREMMLLRGLRAEMNGLKLTRGPKCSTIVRTEYGFRGTHEELMDQLIQDMTRRGVLRKRVTPSSGDHSPDPTGDSHE